MVLVLISLIVLAGAWVQRSVRIQSTAQSFAARLALGEVVGQSALAEQEFRIQVTRRDPSIVCVQAVDAPDSPTRLKSPVSVWLPPVPSARACAPEVPK